MDWHEVITHLYKLRDMRRNAIMHDDYHDVEQARLADYIVMEVCEALASALNEGLRK